MRRCMLHACFALVYTCAYAHSFLVKPTPDWRSKNRPHCRRGGPEKDNCHGPCISSVSWFYNVSSPAHPTLWRRGQRQQVVWTRNGHRFGFIRLTLVPVRQRMSFAAHAKYTFHYSCFESHQHECDASKFECGTDDYLYSTNIIVPDVPDGDYVLGWSWYGAAARSGKEIIFAFGDYWSCAYITIQGGPSSSESNLEFIPKFDPGTGETRCSALVNRLHVCPIEPCKQAFGGKPTLKYFCPYEMQWDGTSCRVPTQSTQQIQKDETKHKESDKEAKNEDVNNEDDKDNKENNDEDDNKQSKDKHASKESNDRRNNKENDTKERRNSKEKKRSICDCPATTSKAPQVSALMLVELDKNGKMRQGSNPNCLCSGRTSRIYITSKQRKYGMAILVLVQDECRNVALLLRRGQIEKRCRYSKHSKEYGAIIGRYRPKLGRKIRFKARADRGSKFGVTVVFRRANE